MGRSAPPPCRDAQVNAITGSLPTELATLSHLKVMDFTDNSLTGIMPSELGVLSMLSAL